MYNKSKSRHPIQVTSYPPMELRTWGRYFIYLIMPALPEPRLGWGLTQVAMTHLKEDGRGDQPGRAPRGADE